MPKKLSLSLFFLKKMRRKQRKSAELCKFSF
jgi:hypothetical protein